MTPTELAVDMRHEATLAADAQTVWRGLDELDMRRSPLVRLLLTLRGMPPRRPLTLSALGHSGFRLLEERPPGPEAPHGEMVLGLIARPWTLRGAVNRDPVDDFDAFSEPGYAVITWSYTVAASATGTLVTTRTAVRCTDETSRRRFLRYWRIVGPFSSVIRHETLRLLRRRVEEMQSGG